MALQKCGEAMAAITLESDSSHSPPVLDKSNERSSKKSPKKRTISSSAAIPCENSRRTWRIIPRSFGGDPATELERSGQKNRKSSATKISAFRLGFLVGYSEATASRYKRKFNVVKIKNTNE
jgi:hypothetical protein